MYQYSVGSLINSRGSYDDIRYKLTNGKIVTPRAL